MRPPALALFVLLVGSLVFLGKLLIAWVRLRGVVSLRIKAMPQGYHKVILFIYRVE